MKANALYHLMQLRARKLSEHLPENRKTELLEIQASLKIQRKPGTYTLDWQVNQKDYSITLESDPFQFYEKGDNAKRNAKRTEALNYRAHNWNAALGLWKDIFFASGLDSEIFTDDGKLAFGKFSTMRNRNSNITNILIALVVSMIAVVDHSLYISSKIFFVSLFLFMFAERFSSVHLRKPIQFVEKIILSIGCIVLLITGTEQLGMLLCLAALYVITGAEMYRHNRISKYILSGFILGVSCYYTPIFNIGVLIVMVFGMVVISIIDDVRIRKTDSFMFIVGVITASLVVNNTFIINYIPYDSNITNVLQADVVRGIGIYFSIILLISSLLWWVTGIQFYLLPWISLISIASASVYTMYSGDSTVALELTVFGGLVIVVTYRVISSFFQKT